MADRPSVLVFDVNETLLDIDALEPHFERLFGDRSVVREWYNQLVMYSMAVTLSENYVDFFTLGQAVLRMLGDIRRIPVTDGDLDDFADGMRTMPAHPDVADGLAALRAQGFRLVTLTNSPTGSGAPTPLDNAGVAEFFEKQFSVDAWRVFKPAPHLYTGVAEALGVAPSQCMMVAAHPWDIMGAQSAGFGAALITRPGNAPLPASGVPAPDVMAADLSELAERLS
ncbi:haloacid dehalogenase, type II [Mycolicibacterium moriokaense]|uniref:Haloacid dehalogenase n=1 Tax=Mycolicibacterium moriokaense TaxID=39691 RepID=A0AAD1HDG9_9MYCO|nr:haloacid dehalogenase type II [Mycolicibacterium moriokaense]MCV7040581.1 haloacid dehalogenase type II [Mycolicibacterium moriokaense]ORB26346.1 haloacid dehalogenase, type II [Mycolicibacterium moriokaense]BBX02810.1 haloacid dehalogenase [Mycolicibacterium moriokaense]